MFSVSMLGNTASPPHGTHYYRLITPLPLPRPPNILLLKLLSNENTGFCGAPSISSSLWGTVLSLLDDWHLIPYACSLDCKAI